ncbi:MAG: hypothetical protein SV422_13500, partial [Pseudomonadota bacterium]|nr:hypothetical protein [Pseudomonadota bacterium]
MAYETATRDAAEQRQDRTQAKPAQGSIVDDRRSSTNAGLQLQTKMASSTLQRNSVAAQSPVQFVTGQHGLDNIKAQIHQGTGRAAQIATDIYNVDVGATHDGDFRNNTIPKIIQSAEEFGYSNAYATRLANNNPFAIGDIPAATSWVNQVARRVESFEFSGESAN